MPRPLYLSTITFFALLLAGPALAADKMYVKASTPLFQSAKGRILGSVPPGTPVTIKKRTRSRVKVVIDGWSEEFQPLNVYESWDVRIDRAKLVRLKSGVRKVIGERVDKWETRWHHVQLTGWISKRSLVSDVSKVWDAAHELHTERCTECHEWRPPEMLKRNQWRGTLVIMSHRAALTPEETALLSQYLQAHARDAKKDETK